MSGKRRHALKADFLGRPEWTAENAAGPSQSGQSAFGQSLTLAMRLWLMSVFDPKRTLAYVGNR